MDRVFFIQSEVSEVLNHESLAMSVYKKYRGLGIGTSLLKQLLQVERLAGYSKISLSVQKSNYAVKMYEKVGFTVADENNEEYIMIVNL